MKKVLFTDNWTVRRADEQNYIPVLIPHDAMITEPRSDEAAAGVNNGWIVCGDYVYCKHFDSDELGGKPCAVLEFEGVYKDAVVTLNGKEVARHDYGWGNFYVDIAPYIVSGDNVLNVSVTNSDQPNCRWYSGTGIIRPVWLYTADEMHILLDSVRVTTISYATKTVSVIGKVSHSGVVSLQICDDDSVLVTKSVEATDGKFECEFTLPQCRLWSTEDPKLYKLRVNYADDEETISFGIRTVELNKQQGLLLNGKRVVLDGACIHSDNGIIGAVSLPEAEERKVRLLQSVGYNAIRSAHNPAAKSLLDACDRLGMLVLDEYVDMWFVHKNKYDYPDKCQANYEDDLTMLVAKDYNHPSVIMYSLGNEIGESSNDKGVAFFNDMKSVIKRYDDTRPVTVGINITFNWMYSMGMGVYTDKKAEDASRKVGSEFFNHIAGLLGSHVMKIMAKLHGCDVKTREIFAASDVAGYNYGILRYQHDLKKYPERFILGTETFCCDAARYKRLAEQNPRLIGDFVWSGMDYLGEVGVGSWEYDDYADSFVHGVGWTTAGSGRIDLVGNMNGEALYTQTVLSDGKPRLAVVPVNRTKHKHSPSAWKHSNAVASWNWQGCEGKQALVELYSQAYRAQLFLNGKCVGRKRCKSNGVTTFSVRYATGKLVAIVYDKAGNNIGEASLSSGSGVKLQLVSEQPVANRGKAMFVHLDYVDDNGNIAPLARGKIDVKVEGGRLLGLGHACPFNKDGYNNDYTDTYYGRALAIVLAEGENVTVTATSKYGTAKVVVPVM